MPKEKEEEMVTVQLMMTASGLVTTKIKKSDFEKMDRGGSDEH